MTVEPLTEVEKAELYARKEKAEKLGKNTLIKYHQEYVSICKTLQPNLTAEESFRLKSLLLNGIEKVYKDEATEEIKGVLWKYIEKNKLKEACIMIDVLLERR